MTDTTTEAVERLMKDVTPGPWEAYHYHSDKLPTLMGVTCPSGDICASVNINELRGKESIANATFIAVARDLVPALLAERDALEAQLAATYAALTPCKDTRAAYSGEVSLPVTIHGYDEDGERLEVESEVAVTWAAIKEIMAMICTRAALAVSKTPYPATNADSCQPTQNEVR